MEDKGPRFLAKILHRDYPDGTLYITSQYGEEARNSIYEAIEDLKWPVDRIEVNEALAPFMPDTVILLENNTKRSIAVIVTREDRTG